jgi:hypothetical protein
MYSSYVPLGLQQLVLCIPRLTLKDKGISILQNIRTADPMCHPRRPRSMIVMQFAEDIEGTWIWIDEAVR